MNSRTSYALLANALLCLSACNKAVSPEKVQEHVAKAQTKAAEDNAKADENVKQVEATTAKDRNDALAKCQALEGHAQKSCKDAANDNWRKTSCCDPALTAAASCHYA